jgi:hypothetical protein
MRFKELVATLGGGEIRRGNRYGPYPLAQWSLSEIREKLGDDGVLQVNNGTVNLSVSVREGTAMILGVVSEDNVFKHSCVFLHPKRIGAPQFPPPASVDGA